MTEIGYRGEKQVMAALFTRNNSFDLCSTIQRFYQ